MEENKNYLYKVCKIIYYCLIKILFRPKAYGTENIPKDGSIIFAGNHKHALDPIVVMSSTNRVVHYMAKEELFKGLHGILFEKIGLIKIYRNKSNPLAIVQAEKILKAGGTIGIFPEGTRNKKEQKLLKFKSGAVVIAKKANSKIVPFAIKGKYRLFRKGLKIEFGVPIDISKMEIDEANNYLRDEVLKLLQRR